ncbi:MAG: pseudouridine synthase [Rhodocyclaceae bacterium]|nr:pseudouridine synthase [Rhodocyclaceae bacterium]
MSRLILLNKPYGVLTQFSPVEKRQTLKDYVPVPGVYAAGRLDADSEGLLLLTDDGALQARIADPRFKLDKTYWAQVEGVPASEQLLRLQAPLDLGDFVTQPCHAMQIDEPENLWPRDPPVRFRLSVPTSWIQLTIREGKNRQVRRMTAKVGLPTLRLIRARIGPWTLEGLSPGEWRDADEIPAALLQAIERTGMRLPGRRSVERRRRVRA